MKPSRSYSRQNSKLRNRRLIGGRAPVPDCGRSSTTRMRSRRSVFKIKCRIAATFGCALLLPALCGCAHLATVKTKPAKLPRTLVTESRLESAKRYLAAAEHESPLGALADGLIAARTSYSALALRPNDDQ